MEDPPSPPSGSAWAHWLELELVPADRPTSNLSSSEEGEKVHESHAVRIEVAASGAVADKPADTIDSAPVDSVFEESPAHLLLHSTAVATNLRTDASAVAALRAAANQVRKDVRSMQSANVSNVGGWQSRSDYLMDEPAIFRPLYPIVYDAVLEYLAMALPARIVSTVASLDIRLSGWANANRRADSNAIHDHVDQDWALSGVIYLDDAGDERCGLEFSPPIPHAVKRLMHAAAPASAAVAAAAGAIATPIFGRDRVPSWLSHWVPPLCAHLKAAAVGGVQCGCSIADSTMADGSAAHRTKLHRCAGHGTREGEACSSGGSEYGQEGRAGGHAKRQGRCEERREHREGGADRAPPLAAACDQSARGSVDSNLAT